MNEQFELRVDPGGLRGLGSINFFIGPALARFSSGYAKKKRPHVIWELGGLPPRGVSLAALVSFLAVSHRIRQFSDGPQTLEFQWQPTLFTFLYDIGFFRIGRELDLFTYDQDVLGGFELRATNPNTGLCVFPFEPPPVYGNKGELDRWKGTKRFEFKNRLEFIAGTIFRERRGQKPFTRNLRETVLETAAELVVNSLLHGKTTAFVGVQRSHVGISIAVCDAGYGLLHSLHEQHGEKIAIDSSRASLNAILIASIIRQKELGLLQTIEEVTLNKGWVRIATENAEVRWVAANWRPFREVLDNEHWLSYVQRDFPIKGLGILSKKNWTAEAEQYGTRTYSSPVRGTRVSFEVPIS